MGVGPVDQSQSWVGHKLTFASDSIPRLVASRVRSSSRALFLPKLVRRPGPFILLDDSFPTGLPAIGALQREPHPTESNPRCQPVLQSPTSQKVCLLPYNEQQNDEMQCFCTNISSPPPPVPTHSRTVLLSRKSAVSKAVRFGSCQVC